MGKNKKYKLSELTHEDRVKLLSKRRIQVLSKYINKHYLKNDKWLKMVGMSLDSIIKYEILKGLDEDFEILRDVPDALLIVELINDKTELIILWLYKHKGILN